MPDLVQCQQLQVRQVQPATDGEVEHLAVVRRVRTLEADVRIQEDVAGDGAEVRRCREGRPRHAVGPGAAEGIDADSDHRRRCRVVVERPLRRVDAEVAELQVGDLRPGVECGLERGLQARERQRCGVVVERRSRVEIRQLAKAVAGAVGAAGGAARRARGDEAPADHATGRAGLERAAPLQVFAGAARRRDDEGVGVRCRRPQGHHEAGAGTLPAPHGPVFAASRLHRRSIRRVVARVLSALTTLSRLRAGSAHA
jgi:hypothetical protein